MTAQVFAKFDHEGVEVSGEVFGALIKEAPGTLWERLADYDATRHSNPFTRSVVNLPLYTNRMAEVFFAVRWRRERLERAKAAHPASKRIKRKDGNA